MNGPTVRDHLWLWGTNCRDAISAIDGPPGPSVAAVHGSGGPSMAAALGPGVVSSPDRFVPFLFVVAEKRVWWISVGRFVLQTPRFCKSLIGVDNYKGLFDEVSITTVACYVIK